MSLNSKIISHEIKQNTSSEDNTNPNDANEECKLHTNKPVKLMFKQRFKEYCVECVDNTPKFGLVEDQSKRDPDWAKAPKFFP